MNYVITAAFDSLPRRNVQYVSWCPCIERFAMFFPSAVPRYSLNVVTHSALRRGFCIQLDIVGVCALRFGDNKQLGVFYVNAYA